MYLYKKWLIKTFVLIIIALSPFLGIIAFNFYIDPLWLFSHSNQYNDVQNPFDERLLKTHAITYKQDNYGAILLGTSRVTYMNEHEFPEKTFNYAVSSMLVEEYDPYLSYAEKRLGKHFETIYIGLDFWGTNINRPKSQSLDINTYLEEMNEPFYRIKKLFSLNTYDYAKENFISSKNNEILFNSFRAYNRDNVASAKEITDEEKAEFLNQFIGETREEVYIYDNNYKKMLLSLKQNHPNSKFVVFLTPVVDARWQIEFKTEEKWSDYKRWVNDVVDVFGECINFMTPNSVTRDSKNFYDTQHAYPSVGTMMINRITNMNENIPQDFGLKLTEDNIKEKFDVINDQRSN